jgi:hypothetical protein
MYIKGNIVGDKDFPRVTNSYVNDNSTAKYRGKLSSVAVNYYLFIKTMSFVFFLHFLEFDAVRSIEFDQD